MLIRHRSSVRDRNRTQLPSMTVSPVADKKQLPMNDDTADDAGESIPTYEEATGATLNPSVAASSSSSAGVVQANTSAHGQRTYPFPSLGSQNEGYGQSPYQSDGTLRIVIAHAPQTDGTTLLPLHATPLQQRRGPRAGRRFCASFFWALVLYIIMGTVLGIVLDLDDDTMPPRKRPTGGPPGWHHHHGDGGNKHFGQSLYQRLLYVSPNTNTSSVA